MTRIAVVTGATGFVGRTLTEALVRDGWHVRALVRRVPDQILPGVEPHIVTDLLDADAVRVAVQGADAVVHLAARVHVMHEKASDPVVAFRAVNVDGTRVVASEAAQAGVGTFLLMSSVKAVAERSDAPIDEHVVARPVDPYGRSKLEAEHLVQEIGAKHGMRTPVLRPPLVYGPGVKANMYQLFRAVDRGIPLPFGAVRNRRSFVYVGNLVHAIRCVLETEGARDTYFVTDQDDVSTGDLIHRIARVLGRSPRLWHIPPVALNVLAATSRALHAVPGLRGVAPALDRLTGSLQFDSTLLSRVTGYHPPTTLLDGLAATGAWYASLRRE